MSHYDELREKDVQPSKRPAVKKAKKKPAKKVKQEADKGGRPKIPIDYDKLSKMCGIHCTGEDCASLLDIDYDTLNRTLKEDGHGGFTDYFKRHSASGRVSLRRKQFEKATVEGNVPMLIWLGKQYLDQNDKSESNHKSSDGSMTPKPAMFNFIPVGPND